MPRRALTLALLALVAAPLASAQPVRRQGELLLLSGPVRFALDSARLRPESFPLLDALASYLRAAPTVRVCIEGHLGARPVGYGRILSRDRALAVLERLVSAGVARERLGAQGFEATRPLVPLGRSASRGWREASLRNARVELRVAPASGPVCSP